MKLQKCFSGLLSDNVQLLTSRHEVYLKRKTILRLTRRTYVSFSALVSINWHSQAETSSCLGGKCVRCKHSQRVTANVHHQLQRRVPVFGGLTSRTPLVVHLCLCNTNVSENVNNWLLSSCQFQEADHYATQNVVRRETALIRVVPIYWRPLEAVVEA